MNIVRVYSGDDGESHFQVVSPEEFAGVAKKSGQQATSSSTRARPRRSPTTTLPRAGNT